MKTQPRLKNRQMEIWEGAAVKTQPRLKNRQMEIWEGAAGRLRRFGDTEANLTRCEVKSLWRSCLRPLTFQNLSVEENTSSTRPMRLRHSLDTERVCRWNRRRSGREISPTQTVRRRRQRVSSAKTSPQENRPSHPRETQPALLDRPRSKPCFSPTFQCAATGSGTPPAEITAVAALASAGCRPSADRERRASQRFVCPSARARQRPRVRRRRSVPAVASRIRRVPTLAAHAEDETKAIRHPAERHRDERTSSAWSPSWACWPRWRRAS